jgi:hypothetical protein
MKELRNAIEKDLILSSLPKDVFHKEVSKIYIELVKDLLKSIEDNLKPKKADFDYKIQRRQALRKQQQLSVLEESD